MWSNSVLNLTEIEQFPTKLFYNLARVIREAVTMPQPLTLNFCSIGYIKCYVLKLVTKFERNRTIHSGVIDDLAHFRHPLTGVQISGRFSKDAWTEL